MSNEINAFLAPEDVLLDIDARCKRDLLTKIAKHASGRLGLDCTALSDALMTREQLGTTAIGQGVAIPHAKVDIDRLWGFFARTARPVEFDALDDKPVDLLFLLLAPATATAEHLKALSRIARTVRPAATQKALRGASDRESLYALATGEIDAAAA
ncbi:MAG: PTS sugar transporter subunit IIA [Pseudomonadota bacterium]